MANKTSPRDTASDRLAPTREGSPDLGQDLDAWLDDALEQTFPASDPIASPPGSGYRAVDAQQPSE